MSLRLAPPPREPPVPWDGSENTFARAITATTPSANFRCADSTSPDLALRALRPVAWLGLDVLRFALFRADLRCRRASKLGAGLSLRADWLPWDDLLSPLPSLLSDEPSSSVWTRTNAIWWLPT